LSDSFDDNLHFVAGKSPDIRNRSVQCSCKSREGKAWRMVSSMERLCCLDTSEKQGLLIAEVDAMMKWIRMKKNSVDDRYMKV